MEVSPEGEEVSFQRDVLRDVLKARAQVQIARGRKQLPRYDLDRGALVIAEDYLIERFVKKARAMGDRRDKYFQSSRYYHVDESCELISPWEHKRGMFYRQMDPLFLADVTVVTLPSRERELSPIGDRGSRII